MDKSTPCDERMRRFRRLAALSIAASCCMVTGMAAYAVVASGPQEHLWDITFQDSVGLRIVTTDGRAVDGVEVVAFMAPNRSVPTLVETSGDAPRCGRDSVMVTGTVLAQNNGTIPACEERPGVALLRRAQAKVGGNVDARWASVLLPIVGEGHATVAAQDGDNRQWISMDMPVFSKGPPPFPQHEVALMLRPAGSTDGGGMVWNVSFGGDMKNVKVTIAPHPACGSNVPVPRVSASDLALDSAGGGRIFNLNFEVSADALTARCTG